MYASDNRTLLVASLPTVIKARPVGTDGRRLVEVQASCEAIDYDGDIILQEALAYSADSFVAKGHLDIDHISELGGRIGIPNPSSYIVGRPVEVRFNEADRTTWVLGEISKSITGTMDVENNRYDEFWASLQCEPPVIWYSSVYGLAVEVIDCVTSVCPANPDGRMVIKKMDWRSLAFTRTPKNEALKGHTRIIKAKTYVQELAKAYLTTTQKPSGMHSTPPLPSNMSNVWNDRVCEKCSAHMMPSLMGYKAHLMECKGYSSGMADIAAYGLMHKHAMEDALARALNTPGA